MVLSDLFKPKFKHSDPNVRKAAIEKITDEEVLADVVKNDEDSGIRKAAIKKITDQEVLIDIVENDKDADLRLVAKAKLKLGRIVKKKDVEGLIKALESKTKTVREEVAEALRIIGGARIIGKGRVLLGSEPVMIPVGDEYEVIDAWNNVCLGKEADQLVTELLTIAKTEGISGSGSKFDQKLYNIRARKIGERLNEIGGIKLMIKAWWRVELEKYRTGLRESRSLDFCWDRIGAWLA